MGLAGFNRIELLDGLPRRLATMDAGRREIGRRAAPSSPRAGPIPSLPGGERVELTPTLEPGDTLRRAAPR